MTFFKNLKSDINTKKIFHIFSYVTLNSIVYAGRGR